MVLQKAHGHYVRVHNPLSMIRSVSSRGKCLFRLCVLLCCLLSCSKAMEVKWTPNPEDEGGGPLPLSMKQREQLLQLEQAIRSSPDPDATLQQVAASNGMSAADLAQMLQRNSADLQQAGGSSSMRRSSVPITVVLWNAFVGFLGLLWQCTKHHPRLVTLLLLSLLSVWYICAIAIPQTGFAINANHPRSGFTRGPTTIFPPPRHFVEEQLLSHPSTWLAAGQESTVKDLLWKHVDWDLSRFVDDGEENLTETWVPDRKKSSRTVQRVTVSQQVINVAELARKIQKSGRQKSSHNTPTDANEIDAAFQETVLEECLDQAAKLCQSPQDITEGTPGNAQSIQFIYPEDNEYGILVVPGMGDWGRYGLLPLFLEPIDEEDDDLSLTLTVAPGGHWDGQIYIAIVPIESSKDEATALNAAVPLKIAVRVAVIVPMKGKAPSPHIAERMTEELARSMAALIEIRTQQSRARSRQSQHYRQSAQNRAHFRRTNRHRLEEQMEEMAVERRRRWQRKNPSGASNYRPSGERMRNPNSAVSFR